jgi:lipid-A-disaccharide synthase
MTPKRFMLIAGEASGDTLAAELVKELRAAIARQNTYTSNVQPLSADLAPRFFGAGGPRMAEAGVELAFDLTRDSVVGIPGLRDYLKFRRLLDQLVVLAREREPHVIICVDFNLFNSVFAAAVKKYVRVRHGTFNNWEPKIIKYISPQVWASREGRTCQIARDFDLLLSIFPFEKAWYAARVPKLRVEFVGHPLIDRFLNAECGDFGDLSRAVRSLPGRSFPAKPGAELGKGQGPSILLLPGSRRKELERHFPVMLEVFGKIRSAMPAASATAVLPNERLAEMARVALGSASSNAAVTIQIGRLPEALKGATIAIASTGTVTMECAYFGVPTVTIYKVSWWEYEIGKRVVKVKSLTMPNLLANEPVFPEFIQRAATAENITRAALELLRDESRRDAIRTKLAQIISTLGGPGASRRAAEAILRVVP